MALENEEVCRFCLKSLANTQFEIIENLKLGMLDVLLLKLNFTTSIAPLVCAACVECLKKAFYFKTACLSIEQKINQYVNATKNRKVDLKDVYLAQKDTKKARKRIKEGHQVCRFCLRLFRNGVLSDIGTDTALTGVLQKYFPELDLNVTKGMSACGKCLDGLTNNFNFIMHSLDTENHIKKYYEMEGIPSDVQINLKHVSQFVAILKSIDPDSDEYNADTTEMNIVETEFVGEDDCDLSLQLESESDEEDSDSTITTSDSVEPEPATNSKTRGGPSTANPPERPRRSSSRLQRCPHCPFQTPYRATYDKHMIQHQDPSQLTMHKCDQCSFTSKHKGSVTRHILIMHKKKATVYECQECPFKTESKHSFRLHGNNHYLDLLAKAPPPPKKEAKKAPKKVAPKKPPPAPKPSTPAPKPSAFQCDVCTFSTKHKGNLKLHLLTHKSKSETVLYKCEICSFETKHKMSLKTHMLRHKDPAEVELHKCEYCEFKTKHKGNLKLHTVIHMDAAEAVMYKCEKCTFETKHKMSLRTHMLRHKKRSEVVRYRCEICEFETLLKGNLKKHELIHKDASELTWYNCKLCGFETIHKSSFKTHSTSFHPPLSAYMGVVQELLQEKRDSAGPKNK